jgi:hypothetical protein
MGCEVLLSGRLYLNIFSGLRDSGALTGSACFTEANIIDFIIRRVRNQALLSF